MQVMVWFYNHVDALSRLMEKVVTDERMEEGHDINENEGGYVSNYAFMLKRKLTL